MKKLTKICLLLLVVCLVAGAFAACDKSCEHVYKDGKCTLCGEADPNYKPTDPTEEVDYVGQLKLDMNSNTAKQEVTVNLYIDGDTTHFNVPKSVVENGIFKARYLGIDTPESTGQIEPYGKKASNFTKEKLSSAKKILIESSDSKWNTDSTGSRYLAWVWYKPTDDGDWRNLNCEILQNGLAKAYSTAESRYGDTGMKAITQAKALKLNMYSGKNDPDYYYGSAKEITAKELRTNLQRYIGVKVAFEGIVSINSTDAGVYVEEYDEETKAYYGIYVYYGKSASGDVTSALTPGNRVRVVGSVSEFQGSYQISGLSYKIMKPDDPENTKKLGEGFSGAYVEISAVDLDKDSKKTIDVLNHETNESESKEFATAELLLGTSVTLKNIQVKSMYTTATGGDSDGAITITGEVDGVTVKIRTLVFKDAQGNIVTQDNYRNKTITVKGIVDSYDGAYQIKVIQYSDVTFQN